MSFLQILQQYANAGTPSPAMTEQHFDTVAQQAPPEALGPGIAEAFRSDQTPPFGEMVERLFGQSNPQQRAGVLNQLLSTLGPGLLSGLAGGALGRVLGSSGGGASPATVPTITPTQASQLTPDQVKEIATHAEAQDPSIVDRLGGFYAQHPQVVRALGGVALAIVLGKMANRNNG